MSLAEQQTVAEEFHHHSLQVVSNIPVPVQRFCDQIDKNFTATSAALRARALELRAAAEELEGKADHLDRAAPTLRADIESWIAFERKSNERQIALALVKPND